MEPEVKLRGSKAAHTDRDNYRALLIGLLVLSKWSFTWWWLWPWCLPCLEGISETYHVQNRALISCPSPKPILPPVFSTGFEQPGFISLPHSSHPVHYQTQNTTQSDLINFHHKAASPGQVTSPFPGPLQKPHNCLQPLLLPPYSLFSHSSLSNNVTPLIKAASCYHFLITALLRYCSHSM